MYKRILIPIDGSKCSDQGARDGIRLASEIEAEVLLLFVIEPLPAAVTVPSPEGYAGLAPYVDDYFSDLKRMGKTSLEAAARLAKKSGVRARTNLVGPAHPVNTIVRIAQRKRCDLIVMGSHGRSGLSRFILGSVTEGVLRSTTKSLLVVHCRGGESLRSRRRRKR